MVRMRPWSPLASRVAASRCERETICPLSVSQGSPQGNRFRLLGHRQRCWRAAPYAVMVAMSGVAGG